MKKLTLLAVTAFAVSACSTINSSESWENYTSDSISTAQLSDNQSLAVFYRTENFNGPAVNVYVNGDYQVSLLENGYSPITLCANNQLITASYSHEGFGNRTKGARYDLPARETAFFRAAVKSGEVVFERVEDATAREEIKALTGKVSHSLSRVTHNCR